ncbi:bifunctional 1-(5-phosphoribosyl)-5-((5-phosphoribosylamino)methylideneamino)imidazole-4-carboxamide isomerase/phosphoribosylanthranilate isomerase PriA [Schaalia sp. ZJ405]|uniref:bifunctional 1-(5-phosphoribosyl)-5-((5- phosphoribosylamino)methylideneamino)imidazole-4- carboxamide isomerase/phosphoribosylanthranilate isomerase PriA n=1 Tax=unclassified Schaalia TaxID=2691889 RepID=UPI0013ECCE91|nr:MULTISPECIES: bifunctional 1-(5-phosphoribosyl)-5-((5-phosphoribosylamino)methylideneamino)imidazole-4-carboxamide isomerase/phosphoribosylanthranilate isomerase PriA [unclassified Schaalia]QPK81886.1 bifunctional 1-(5-phosphoribosyl)-5-((5-phosphoribosylamino)methylideneamino)imidazole-4-carboxamide isomerase/phosphoribosylanthranilate isomerase PriA [Schaalia sp. ZJ405]
MTQSLTLLPAVDVVDGKAVRLRQGAAGTETDYGHPMDAARSFVDAGATWLHLVDLDAAFGRGSNAPLLADITRELPIHVELSGGIRDDESLARALDAGARRVNLGTAALEDPQWTERVIGEFGDRIAVGLDVRGETLSARGWTREGGNLWEAIDRLNHAGCVRYVVTDVARDGMLSGPNVELLRRVCAATDAAVVASGGVSSLADIAVLRELVDIGVEGAIVGKALYSGQFTLEEALAVARGTSEGPRLGGNQ